MARATEMDGRDEEKFLVFLRFILTFHPTPVQAVLAINFLGPCALARATR